MISITPLKSRITKGRISPNEILLGSPISKIDRLKVMGADEFEDLVYEWAHEYLATQYKSVSRLGGAGDKGRDVIAYKKNGDLVIYQCKHYANQIAPNEIYLEFGKLCYYTFTKQFEIPSKYYIVSTNGVGPSLYDLLKNPDELRNKLKKNWTNKCETKIVSKKQIKLEDNFLNFVDSFPFEIIDSIEPLDLINQHSKTIYHPPRFGGGLIKTRTTTINVENNIAQRELVYIKSLFEVYEEELGTDIKSYSDLKYSDEELYEHFNSQRYSFYSAESLERFSRDNFPDSDPLPFDELKRESKSIIHNALARNRRESGFVRMIESVTNVEQQQFTNNALRDEITVMDKGGLCHHLVNDGVIKSWIRNRS